jgi:hypothetical protein
MKNGLLIIMCLMAMGCGNVQNTTTAVPTASTDSAMGTINENAKNGVAEMIKDAQGRPDGVAPVANEPVAEIAVLKNSMKADGLGNAYTYVTLKNNTSNLASYVDVNVVYYDKGGNVVGTGMGNTANLAAGRERVVTCIAMEIEGAYRYEVSVNNVMWQ